MHLDQLFLDAAFDARRRDRLAATEHDRRLAQLGPRPARPLALLRTTATGARRRLGWGPVSQDVLRTRPASVAARFGGAGRGTSAAPRISP